MVVPLFGWSAGDVVVSIKILYAIAEAFKEATDAKAQYFETSTWLQSFAGDLKRLNDYTGEHPRAKYTNDLIEKAGYISKHYEAFERYLQKYDKALSSSGKANKAISAVKKIKWASKELKGQVQALKSAASAPLLSVNLLLELQLQTDLASVADKVALLPTSSRIEELEDTFGQLTLQMDYLPNVQANIQRDIERIRLMIQETYQGPAPGVHHELLQAYKEATTQIVEKLDGNRSTMTQALSTIRESLQDLKDLQTVNREGDRLRSTQLEILDSLERLVGKSDKAQISLKGLFKSLSKVLENRAEDKKSGSVSGQLLQTTATVTGIGLAVANIAYVKTSVDGLRKRLPVQDSHQMSPAYGGATNSYVNETQSQTKQTPVNTRKCPVNPDCSCGPGCLCGKNCACGSGTMNTNEASSLSSEFLQSSFNAVATLSTHHDGANYNGPISSKLNGGEEGMKLELQPDPRHIPGAQSRRKKWEKTKVSRAGKDRTTPRTSRASRSQRDDDAKKQRPKGFESLEQERHLENRISEYKPSQVYTSQHHLDDNEQNHTTLSQQDYSSGQYSHGHSLTTSRQDPGLQNLPYAVNRYIRSNGEPHWHFQNNVEYGGVEGSSTQSMTTTRNIVVDGPSVTRIGNFVDVNRISLWENEGMANNSAPLDSAINEEHGYLRRSSSQITFTNDRVVNGRR